MKRLLALGLASILVVSLISGCSSGVMTYTDAAKTISASVNQEFAIALDSNPTTGYNWETSYDDSILSLVESRYEIGKQAKEGLDGAGGTQNFRFKALKTGKAEITVTYKRSWETDFAEQKVFSVDIK